MWKITGDATPQPADRQLSPLVRISGGGLAPFLRIRTPSSILESGNATIATTSTTLTALNPASVSVAVNSPSGLRSEEHTSELQSLTNLVCRLLLEKKKFML